MNNKINLLKNHTDKARQNREKTLKFFRLTAICLIVFVGAFSAFLFFWLRQSPLPSLQKKEAALLSNLSLLHTKRTKLLLTQKRSQDIASLVENRYRPDKVLARLSTLFSESVSAGTLSLNKEDLTITLSSPSLLMIDTFLSSLVNLAESEELPASVVLDGFTVDPKASQYTFSLHMQFNE